MYTNRQFVGRRDGITLVEGLVALTVFSVSILGLLAALFLSYNVSARGEHLDTAVVLARTKLQETISGVADAVPASQQQSERFAHAVTVEERPGGLMAATVTVQWLEGGRMQEYVLSEVFRPVGPQPGGE